MKRFLSIQHQERFNELLLKECVGKNDLERYAMFFIISGNDDLYKKAKYIYDFNKSCIFPDVFVNSKVDFCSSSKNLIKLAFNLYNNYDSDQTVIDTFCYLDDSNFSLAIEAIKIRFNKT